MSKPIPLNVYLFRIYGNDPFYLDVIKSPMTGDGVKFRAAVDALKSMRGDNAYTLMQKSVREYMKTHAKAWREHLASINATAND